MPDISNIAILTAFTAGIISFLSPCVLPLVPGYISYIAGQSFDTVNQERRARSDLYVFVLGVLFVLGFSTVFVALGASATALGQLLLTYRYEANIVGGTIIIIFGFFLTGLFNIPWFQRDLRFHGNLRGGHPLTAYILGLAFAFGWTPFGVYSLGLGVPFLLAAVFTSVFIGRMKVMRRIGRPLQIVAGVVLIIMGIAMITGQLSVFAYWLLKTFPGLATIG
jgi:cytochrome c-type biogenesis protein